MNETKHEAFSGPVDDYIDGHVFFVQSDFFSFWPGKRRAVVAELTTNVG
jgi:hypothetical protein